jgi:nitrate reductase beta subunit
VTCKNVWTSREGMEYAWFNNVETKPGIGYPKDWENQKRWNGGWVRDAGGSIRPKMGGKWRMLAKIFANPTCPRSTITTSPSPSITPPAKGGRKQGLPHRPPAQPDFGPADGEDRMGPELGGNPRRGVRQAAEDYNFEGVQKEIYGQFENTFMMYLPRLCEHCLNPTCVAACPSGAIYKREEDGIVLIDQESAAAGACACRAALTRRSITTGKPANRKSASSAIRASRRASRRCAARPASGASATLA